MKIIIETSLVLMLCVNVFSGENLAAKRGLGELSFSYAATDISSKEGNHVKTITVIKNVAHKIKDDIPEIQTNKDWAAVIKDSFDANGNIPDLSFFLNIDDKGNEKKGNEEPKRESVPIYEDNVEQTTVTSDQKHTETESPALNNTNNESSVDESALADLKVPDDVEFIETHPINTKHAQISAKAQSQFNNQKLKSSNQKYEKDSKNSKSEQLSTESQPSSHSSIIQKTNTVPETYPKSPQSQNFGSDHTFGRIQAAPMTEHQILSPCTTGTRPYLAPKLISKIKPLVTPTPQLGATARIVGTPSSSSQKPYVAPRVTQIYGAPISVNIRSTTIRNNLNLGYPIITG